MIQHAARQGLRAFFWLAFFAGILAAWAWLFAMARMAGLDPIGRSVGMSMMPMSGLGVLLPMWAVMMAAMMGPTLVPTLMAYDALPRATGADRAGWLGVVAGYGAVWLGVALAAALLQVALLRLGLIDQMGRAVSLYASAGLLLAAGAFQFTRAKAVCHGVCHGPTLYFLGRFRPGPLGGARMGAGLGLYCAACCWAFMALGFAGGVMNLLWMGLATLFMVIEKLPQIGHHVIRPVGAALIAMGLGVAVWAATLAG